MAEQRVERRLAAILAGDVAGYSRLMGADEEGTLSRLNAHRREFLEPKIADHRGRIVKRTGDGVLIEFASAVDATRCAIEIQRGMVERNAPVPQDKRIELRIGIHVGDVIIEDSDIFGDGVNIAARLEGIGPALDRGHDRQRGRRQGRARPHHHPAGRARSHRAYRIAAILDHRLGRAAEPRDQLPHRVRRGAQQPAPGWLLDAPAYGQCPRCERQRLGQRRLRFLFPAQLEFPTCQYSSARRPILSTNATALVVRSGTPRVGRMVAQGQTWRTPSEHD